MVWALLSEPGVCVKSSVLQECHLELSELEMTLVVSGYFFLPSKLTVLLTIGSCDFLVERKG